MWVVFVATPWQTIFCVIPELSSWAWSYWILVDNWGALVIFLLSTTWVAGTKSLSSYDANVWVAGMKYSSYATYWVEGINVLFCAATGWAAVIKYFPFIAVDRVHEIESIVDGNFSYVIEMAVKDLNESYLVHLIALECFVQNYICAYNFSGVFFMSDLCLSSCCKISTGLCILLMIWHFSAFPPSSLVIVEVKSSRYGIVEAEWSRQVI